MDQSKIVFTITGPSGSGKTFLAGLLKEKGFVELISTTTRLPREGEVSGQHYHFIDKEEFAKKVANSEMVESIEFNGQCYGLTQDEFDRAFEKNRPVAVVCEPNGVQQIRAFADNEGWELFSVYIENPLEVLLERLLKRFKEDTDGSPKRYASRIAGILQEEIHWKNQTNYELNIPAFNEENRDDVVETVCRVAQQLQVNPQSQSL